MRNKMAEYVVKNSQLKKLNDQNQFKIASLQSNVDQVNSQVGMLELQNQQLNQKLTKRQFKYQEQSEWQEAEHNRAMAEMRQEKEEMLARITELEMAAGRKWKKEKDNLVTLTRFDEHDGTFNAQRNSTSGLETEGPVDDNRVRKLLVDLEN